MAKVDKAPKEHSLNNELKDTIKDTRERSQRIVKFGKQAAQDFGRVDDLAGIFEPLVDSLSTDSDLEPTMDYWKGIQGLTFKMEEGIDKLDLHAVSSTASGTVSELASDTQYEIYSIDLSDSPAEVVLAVGEFKQFVENPELAVEVRELLQTLGLAAGRTGKVSPLEQFQAAFEGYESEEPPVKSLIPMRSSITECVATLLEQRPKREATSNEKEKIKSIHKQLAYDYALEFSGEDLAERWHDLNRGVLSSAKTDRIDRSDFRNRVNQAVLWYHAFLKSIDPKKLRRPPEPEQ